ncbi:MAG: sodium/proline symporter PutP [Clostridiales Family XIII bacterium]|jgi:sodium/proline symporter|nr:sodium/proline symporter PutP [Clostridiales Family XIII bacterium]
MNNIIWIIIAFVVYVAVMIVIGTFSYKRNTNLSEYFLGGRNLNAWVAALSAQASDMSGWLLMGLPGAVYALGTGQVWIAVGLGIGTILNWIIVAKRLRRYTIVSGNSITIPEYLENRFHDTSKILRIASAIFIAIFFAVYTASGFVAGATLFEQIFGLNYNLSLVIGVVFILAYTFLGGFRAVCWTDLIQGLLMFAAILLVPIVAYATIADTALLPVGFTDVLGDGAGGTQSAISVVSQLAWGLGYFGMPHVLVRFMAIKSDKTVRKSAIIAIIWVAVTLIFAIITGLVGKMALVDLADSETVFIVLIQRLFLSEGAVAYAPLLGGFFLCGILAAIMSTADSQLLVTASSFTSDIYKNALHKGAGDRHLVWVSRVSVIVIAAIAFIIATNRTSSIMGLVSNAWSGFGSTFGALVLLSLYWRRVNRAGAFAGVISGGLTVIIWDYIPVGAGETLAAATGVYSLLIGFIVSFLFTVVVSLVSAPPSKAMLDEFETVRGAADVDALADPNRSDSAFTPDRRE